MKKKPFIKYNDFEECLFLNSYSISENMVKVSVPDNILFKDCGFSLYDRDGQLIKDCYDFTYRWDVLNAENPTQHNVMVFTNNSNLKQQLPFLTQEEIEKEVENLPVEPLTNGELTEIIGNLLYENSLLQIGLSVKEEVL